MKIDVSLVPLSAVVRQAKDFPLARFSFAANASAEQVVLELV